MALIIIIHQKQACNDFVFLNCGVLVKRHCSTFTGILNDYNLMSSANWAFTSVWLPSHNLSMAPGHNDMFGDQ